ncbi:hypothetical protein GCM10009830_34230 [Glycomyces endophyticus]|uniref:Class I SAM-dependent methyltransferase n=1 Tax=Glycomyces endophyticus TaxID=480996 RepID=A0ABN2H9H2_9ACTN
MINPFRRIPAAVACAAAAAAVLGFIVDGAPLAAYAMLSVAALGGAYAAWHRSRAHQRRLEALVAQQFTAVEESLRKSRAAHAGKIAAVTREVERLGATLDRVAADIEGLSGDRARSAQSAENVDRILTAVDKLPNHTSRVVRAWTRTLYAEMEDLLALYRDIDPDRSLPLLHGWAAGADLARFLYNEVTANGSRNIVECGCGTTTVILAYALKANGAGRVTALEHQPEFAEATRRLLADHGLTEWAQVLDAPLTEVKAGGATALWYDYSGLPHEPVDLVFVDGPPQDIGPEARFPAVPVLFDRLAPDAVIVLDDAHRREERIIGERWSEEFPGFTVEKHRHDYGTLVLRRGVGG